MWPVAMKRSSFQEEIEMKMQFNFTGDVNALVIAVMSGFPFTLVGDSGKTLKIEPKMSREGMQLSVKSANVNSERIMTVPVKIPDFGGEAMMSFQYQVKDVVVAPAVAPVAALDERPTVYGISNHFDVTCWKTEEGLRISEKYLKGDVLLNAEIYDGHAGRPAVEGRPEVRVPQFMRGTDAYHALTINFE